MSNRRRSLAVLILTTVATLALAGSALGANRYAAPNGKANWPCTDKKKPCTLTKALTPLLLQDGDQVLLQSGRHVLTDNFYGLYRAATMRPAPGADRPRVVVQGTGGFYVPFAGATIRGITFENSQNSTPTINLQATTTLDGIIAISRGNDGMAILLAFDSVVRNSIAYSTGTFGAAVLAVESGGFLRNVTAVATGSDGSAIVLNSCWGTIGVPMNINAYNTLVRGSANDLHISNSCAGRTGTLEIGHSAYSVSNNIITGAGIGITPTVGNVNRDANPLRIGKAPLAGLFEQKKTSSTINKGTLSNANLGGIGTGSTDLAGNKRTFGSAPDIGATEYDNKKPRLTAKAKRKGSKSARLTTKCYELCSFRVSGGVKTVKRELVNKGRKLKLKLKLKKPGAPRTTIKVVATDLSGNRTVRKITLR